MRTLLGGVACFGRTTKLDFLDDDDGLSGNGGSMLVSQGYMSRYQSESNTSADTCRSLPESLGAAGTNPDADVDRIGVLSDQSFAAGGAGSFACVSMALDCGSCCSQRVRSLLPDWHRVLSAARA